MKNLTAPKWASKAIATDKGWVNPKTGELLVSFRGLKSLIEKNKPLVSPVLEINEIENPIIQSVEVDLVVEEKKSVKSRAKKTQNGA